MDYFLYTKTNMSKSEIITGLDIGSNNIRIAVGELSEDFEQMNIIGLAEGKSSGVSKGNIRSIEEVVEAIAKVKTKAEKMTSVPIDHAVVSVSGSHIMSQTSRGVVSVSRADEEIRENDVDRVLENAQAVSVPANYEILHVLPKTFSIENQTGIKDPIGMSGVRLEVEAQIIEGQTSHIRNIEKAVNLAGFEIDDFVLGCIAAAECTLSERQKDLGVALVNIGATTTSVLVFEEEDISLVRILPIGSGHITNDIAIGLRTNIDIAETIKIQYGSTIIGLLDGPDEVQLSLIDEKEDGVFSKKYLTEIIEARVEEIFTMVDKELRVINRSGKLPSGVVLTGGGSKLPGIIETAKKVFRLPASIGNPVSISSAIDKLNSPDYTTAVGLVQWGIANHLTVNPKFGLGSIVGSKGVKSIGKQVKSLFSFLNK
jgi:cell division protein FtsA